MMGRTVATIVGAAGMGTEREQVVARLFDAHYQALRALAHGMLGEASAAEEVASDVFVKAFGGWRRFRSVEHQPSYLRAMVVNECRSRLRRRKVEERVNEASHRSAVVPTNDIDRRLGDLDLLAAVRTLPPRQRACVVLRYMEDLPDREIADILGCSIGTVKSQLSKARARLERELSQPGGTTHE